MVGKKLKMTDAILADALELLKKVKPSIAGIVVRPEVYEEFDKLKRVEVQEIYQIWNGVTIYKRALQKEDVRIYYDKLELKIYLDSTRGE